MTVKLRYKNPKESQSKLIVRSVIDKNIPIERTSDNFRFSSSVAMFGMILRESEFKGNSSFEKVLAMANNAKGNDDEGYRSEFVKLVKMAQVLKEQRVSREE